LTRVYLAGHTGLVGSAVLRALRRHAYEDVLVREETRLDLTDQAATRGFFAKQQPDAVIVAAAKVGGILANWEQPYEFIAVNLAIELNVIDAAFRSGVQRLIFLGSSCIYPREAPQPLREEYLLSGPLEETNRPYALAKIAGVELCRSLNREHGTDYLSLMPTNLYGPGDNYDLRTSHVLPALIRRFHEAKLGLPDEDGRPRAPQAPVVLWGTGTPLREFLHVDAVAEAIGCARENVPAATVPDALLNVGVGRDQTIAELAMLVQRIVGHTGRIEWDTTKPDGTMKKQLDVGRLTELGWRPTIDLEAGSRAAYRWYLEHCTAADGSFVDPRAGA